MNDSRVLVEVDAVTKVYQTRHGYVHALSEVSLGIREHEFVSILGPSGCGKSTLMLMVSGLEPASSGSIRINDKPIDGPHTDLGIVFQRDALLRWRTALDNVMLQAEIRHLPRAEYRERALSLLQQVGLTGFENAYPSELSGGMRQRVAICRALVHDAPLLVMDEPFGALDALTRDQMGMDLLRIWDRDRKTVIFVTHSIPEAVFLSDRVLVMSPRPGRIEADIRIELPRPRALEITETSEFAGYEREIHRIFVKAGVLR